MSIARWAGSTGANKNCRSPPSGRIYYAKRSRQAALLDYQRRRKAKRKEPEIPKFD